MIVRYRLADIHSYTHTCRHMDLSVRKDMLLCCSEALPSNCHPLCGSFDTTTHTLTNKHIRAQKTSQLSLHTQKSASLKPKHIPSIFIACAVSASCSTQEKTPPPPTLLFICFPLSYHLFRSRRWFFGRSCRAHRSQAPASLYSSPPSLHTPTHTVLSGSAFTPSPCSSIIQPFARTHACARTLTLKWAHTV